MKQQTSQILYSYWNEVRAGRSAPKRFEIEPASISHILSQTLILERVETSQFRFRLAGTKICEILGTELRGTELLDLWTGEDRACMRGHLAHITDRRTAGVFEIEASDGTPRHRLRLELLLLPLEHTRDTIDRVLGSLSLLTHPHWIGAVPLTEYRLLSAEVFAPTDGPGPRMVRTDQIDQPEAPAASSTPSPSSSPVFPSHVRSARIVRHDRRQFRVYNGGLSSEP